MTLALGSIFTLMGLVWPLFALAGLAAIVGSAIADMDGGRGWVRSLLVADPSHNLLVWPDDCVPGVSWTPKPTLLITSPIENHCPQQIGTRMAGLSHRKPVGIGHRHCGQLWLGPYLPTACAVLLAISSAVLQLKD